MYKGMQRTIYLFFGLLALAVYGTENLSIGQIDSSSLLLDQQVKLYLSVTDEAGRPVEGLARDMFAVSESSDETTFTPLEVTGFSSGANKLTGIHFLLLIDNSGSMYNTPAGLRTDDANRRRIAHALGALRDFLSSVTNPADTVGLAYFNTYYVDLVKQTRRINEIEDVLEQIQRPSAEANEDYTELYAALTLAAERLSGLPGRKVIIVLSDGRNEDYLSGTGTPHPIFADKTYTYDEPVTRYQEEGISCFAIDFGGQGDRMLDRIAFETGGKVFAAASREELANVYQDIQQRILGEYLLSYRAGMEPADKKFVRVAYTGDDGISREVTRFYFSSTLFGLPLASLGWLFLIPVFAALLIWFLLTRIKFLRPNRQPGLQVLSAGAATQYTQAVPLAGNATVIGRSEDANLTIAGVAAVKHDHATILFDDKAGEYTLVSKEEVMVNNQPVKKKKLEAGDVINVGGTTIVFDDEVLE